VISGPLGGGGVPVTWGPTRGSLQSDEITARDAAWATKRIVLSSLVVAPDERPLRGYATLSVPKGAGN
jgi:hypothetical protein